MFMAIYTDMLKSKLSNQKATSDDNIGNIIKIVKKQGIENFTKFDKF